MKALGAVYAGVTGNARVTDSSIYLCGTCYSERLRPSQDGHVDEYAHAPHVYEFYQDAMKLPYFCYRKDFVPIEHTSLTSDAGWGCMLRTGQMAFAHAFLRHYGKDSSDSKEIMERKIISMFEDSPRAHYSIHNIAKFGMTYEKTPGEWFGPSTIANVMKLLVSIHPLHSDDIEVHVEMNGSVNIDEIISVCTQRPKRIPLPHRGKPPSSKKLNPPGTSEGCESPPEEPFKACIILVVVRLGLDTINPIYIPGLLSFFQFPQSLGILGGKPNASYYFVGVQDNHAFYLDPHQVRSAVDMSNKAAFPLDSFHLSGPPGQMPLDRMDPSMVIGFYIRDRDDLRDWCERVHVHANGGVPIFTMECAPDMQQRQHSNHPEADEDDIIEL